MQQIEKRLVRILKLQIERNLTQQPDQVLDLCEELLRFAVETDDSLLYGEAVLYRGKAYLALKKIDIAGTNFEEALGLFKELGDHARVSLSLNALGAVSQLKADRPAAIRYYHAALQAAKQADSGIYLYKPLVNLAQIFFANHTYSKALMYAREAIATSWQWEIDEPKSRLYHMAAKLYDETGDQEKARGFCIESIRYAEQEGSDSLYASSSMTLALLEVKIRNYAQAETLLKALLQYTQKHKLKNVESLCAIELVKLWFRRGNHAPAFTVLIDQVNKIRKELQLYSPQSYQVFKLIGDYCRFVKQDLDAANRYYRLYLTMTKGVWKRYLTA
jgi:tetratricopeptide (TPR) repeat protein